MTTLAAKKIIRAELDRLGFADMKLTAKTVNFMDLARDSCVFVKVHGWKPHPAWEGIDRLAKDNGFRVDCDGIS